MRWRSSRSMREALCADTKRTTLSSLECELLQLRPPDDIVDLEIAGAEVERGEIADRSAQVAEFPEPAPDLLHHITLAVIPPPGGGWITGEEPVPQATQREHAL